MGDHKTFALDLFAFYDFGCQIKNILLLLLLLISQLASKRKRNEIEIQLLRDKEMDMNMTEAVAQAQSVVASVYLSAYYGLDAKSPR